MAGLNDVLDSAVPQGSLAKPLLVALGALLASGALFKNATAPRRRVRLRRPPLPKVMMCLGGWAGCSISFNKVA